MVLNKKQLSDVCRLGGGAHTCSYLVVGAEFECAKGTSIESVLRGRREAGTMNAGGDNCSGPPEFDPSENSLVTQ